MADTIKTVAFPGLGTGVGGIGPNTCAWQVRAAIEEVLLEKGTFPTSWHDAHLRHHKLYRDQIPGI